MKEGFKERLALKKMLLECKKDALQIVSDLVELGKEAIVIHGRVKELIERVEHLDKEVTK